MKFAKLIILFIFLSVEGLSVSPSLAEESAGSEADPRAANTKSAFGVADKFGVSEGTEEEGKTVVPEEELVYLNATDVDIKDMIKQISKATGTNFIIDDKVRGKITIISEKPMTQDMAYQAFLSSLEVMGFTTVQTPGGLLKIVQTKDAITQPLDIYRTDTPYTDRFITRIIQVQNISANDLSSVVKSLISKEGNLFAYPATNTLIMTDTGSNIDRILKIIKELDHEGPQEVIEIIPIVYADSSDITEKVLQLFEEEASAKGKTTASRRRRSAKSAELEEVPSVSKVISDERTNSVIVLGTKRAILKIKALIARLDSKMAGIEGRIHVYYLKHANAKEMAEVLSSLVGDAGGKTSAKKGAKAEAKTGAVELEGGVKVTADEGTNSLVITASPKDFETLIEKVVAKLDIPRRQVYLEAVVMELTVDKIRTLGFSGNFANAFGLKGERIAAFGSILPITPTSISSIATAAGGLAGGGFSERTFDFTLADGSTISIPAVSAIIQALQTDTDVNVLSTPSILTLDNEEAQIQVGQEVPTPSGTTVSSGVTTFNVTREDTGIILKITPQISESNTVRLKMEQEITNVVGNDPNLGPTLTKRSVNTVVVAHDKQTIVIGGLIDDHSTATTNKVPFLGDVPVLGNLFKNKTNRKIKTNIVIFITPYIIRDRSDYLGILSKKIEERNLFIELNYGTSQKKTIRQSIRNHAKDLLEYRTAVRDVAGSPAYDQGPSKVLDSGTPPTQVESVPSESEEASPESSSKNKSRSSDQLKYGR